MIETEIEVGERSKTEMTYDEAVMYCLCLGDGWRLPTEEEYYEDYVPMGWFLNEPSGQGNLVCNTSERSKR
jgi:hypothetical protein